MNDFRNHPQIEELLEILDRNGLNKEKEEVNALVDYINDMENTLSDMMIELTAMRQDVRQIHDSSLQAKCAQLLEKTTEKVKTATEVVKTAKENFIFGAKNAVNEFKLKGKDALIKAIEGMRIPHTIERLQDCFSRLSQNMERNASRTEVFRAEMEEASTHLKKAGRSLLGLTSKEYKHKEADKGILAKLQSTYSKLSVKFEQMEQKTKGMLEKFKDKKNSVKTELANLKSTVSKDQSAPEKEQSR